MNGTQSLLWAVKLIDAAITEVYATNPEGAENRHHPFGCLVAAKRHLIESRHTA